MWRLGGSHKSLQDIRAERADVVGVPRWELWAGRFQPSESKSFLTVRTDQELDPSKATSRGSECLITGGVQLGLCDPHQGEHGGDF